MTDKVSKFKSVAIKAKKEIDSVKEKVNGYSQVDLRISRPLVKRRSLKTRLIRP